MATAVGINCGSGLDCLCNICGECGIRGDECKRCASCDVLTELNEEISGLQDDVIMRDLEIQNLKNEVAAQEEKIIKLVRKLVDKF